MRILHLARRDEWAQARAEGWYRGSTADASLADVGFVHLSVAEQLPGVLTRFYADADLMTLVLLVVDPAISTEAGSALKWELADGGAGPFPHIYGPIPRAAVVAVLELTRGADGVARMPDLDGYDVLVRPLPVED